MAQKRFDWVVGDWAPWDSVQGVEPTFAANYQISDTFALHLISDDDLAAKNDRLRVERVVGQVFFQIQPLGLFPSSGQEPYPAGAGLFLMERIYVYEARAQVDPAAAQDLLGASGFEDADRSFMWNRTRVIDIQGMSDADPAFWVNTQTTEGGPSAASGQQDGGLGYSAFDVHVKRVLMGRAKLLYQAQVHPYLPGGNVADFDVRWALWPFIRVGVKF